MTAKYLLLCIPLLLVGCFFDSADEAEKIKNADSHAVGAACRQNLRGIEDCFTLNPKSRKAHILLGWKEMDAYIRENEKSVVNGK